MNISLKFQQSNNLNKVATEFYANESLSLTAGNLLKIPGDRRGLKIAVQRGHVWVTQEGDHSDYMLNAGDCFEISQRGAVLVQGMNDARFRFH